MEEVYDLCHDCANRIYMNKCLGCDGRCNFIPVDSKKEKYKELKG